MITKGVFPFYLTSQRWSPLSHYHPMKPYYKSHSFSVGLPESCVVCSIRCCPEHVASTGWHNWTRLPGMFIRRSGRSPRWPYCNWLVVWLPSILFSHILGTIIPTDFHIFQRGGPTTHQIYIIIYQHGCNGGLMQRLGGDLSLGINVTIKYYLNSSGFYVGDSDVIGMNWNMIKHLWKMTFDMIFNEWL